MRLTRAAPARPTSSWTWPIVRRSAPFTGARSGSGALGRLRRALRGFAILAEYLRSWRVNDADFAIAQAMRPGARFEYHPNPRWTVQGSFVLSRGEGFHAYDNAQSEFLVSYVRPVHRGLEDGTGSVAVAYPTRFSFGVQQQTFYNFSGKDSTAILPVIRFTLF